MPTVCEDEEIGRFTPEPLLLLPAAVEEAELEALLLALSRTNSPKLAVVRVALLVLKCSIAQRHT